MTAKQDSTGNDINTICCSFCGIPKTPTVPLIAGNNGHICEQCIKLAYQVVASWGRMTLAAMPELKSPSQIKKHLDDHIIGQNDAKRTLATALYHHYLRLKHHDKPQQPFVTGNTPGDTEVEKSNILMTGPSGTGKTLLVKSLAKIIGVPFVIGDATTLTQAGYVGQDAESLLKRLLEASEWDVSRAEWGIVYIDEIDKLARAVDNGVPVRDVSGEGVQQALLKMIEGSEVRISKGGQREGQGEEVILNTQNILFIAGGAFPGLVELINKRIQPAERGIGFQSKLKAESLFSSDEMLAAMLPADLQRFGLIPEFIGRFPVITFLQELDIEALKRILTEPKGALSKQYQALFSYQGVALEFSSAAIEYIAEQAVDRGTGARGLRSIMESFLSDIMFELPDIDGLRRCIVELQTDDTDNKKILIRKEFVHSGHQTQQQVASALSGREC